MPDQQTSPTVYYKRLELENIRCFGKRQVVDLSGHAGCLPQWTLLLGDNGVGKTTLLQCLAWMRPVPAPKKQKSSPDIQPALAAEENKVLNSLLRVGESANASIEAVLSSDQKLNKPDSADAKEIKTSIQMEGSNQKLRDFKSYGNHPEKSTLPFHNMPIFIYGADRRMGKANMEKRELLDPLASLFSGSTELYDAEELLLNLDYRSMKEVKSSDTSTKKRTAKPRLEKVKSMLARILPDIGHASDIEILGPKGLGVATDHSGVKFCTPYGSIALSALSLGYQTTVAWVLDLAIRLYQHYPNCLNPLNEPAIVMIDEIDLHLHPLWQRYIVEYLSDIFPQIQFIATAHSPLMVQTSKDKNMNLIVLRQVNGRVEIEKNPLPVEGWRVDQILTSPLFGVSSSRSPHIEDLIRVKRELASKLNLSATEEERLREVKQELEGLPTAENLADQDAMEIIRKVAGNLGRSH